MKLFIQIMCVVGAIALFLFVNSCANVMKQNDCVRSGGKFVLNTSDATRSACILGN